MDPPPRLNSAPGTYALVLRCDCMSVIRVGRLGPMRLQPGFYIYVGSALGPGGVRARLAHHLRIARRPHWHIDHLRPHVRPVETWYSLDPTRREHEWARAFSPMRACTVPIEGFGSSDCACRSHLYHSGAAPSPAAFRRRLRMADSRHAPIRRFRWD